ncbi:MAG TPA: hypothetical protein P5544_16870 [Candidatus Nanopelagicales bacterium]|nr:hypothetical protein [Candidatus Nanopelagicales bacterium]
MIAPIFSEPATSRRRRCSDCPRSSPIPRPRPLLTSIGTAPVKVELRFWSGARQLETREAKHLVIREVLAAFAREDVRTGSEVLTIDPGPAAVDLIAGRLPRPRAWES